MGGVIVDSGKFDWTQNDKFPGISKPNMSYHGVVFTDICKDQAYIMKLRNTLMRDQGAVISPFNAFITTHFVPLLKYIGLPILFINL